MTATGGRRMVRWKTAFRPFIRFLGLYLFASLAVFLAIRAMPGDPVSLRIKNPDPARIQEIREQLGLEDPLPAQYLSMLTDFVRGDWGESLVSGRSVAEMMRQYLPATLELGLCAVVLGVAAGLLLALGGHASGSRCLLRLTRGLGSVGLIIPIFWIGLLWILLFSVQLGWLPSGGRFDYSQMAPEGTGFLLFDSLREGNASAFGNSLRHLVLPVLTLALYPAAVVAATADAKLREPRTTQLVQAQLARGFHPLRIWGKHVLRLVAAPVITVVGTQTGALLGGAVLTETVFSWPGVGRFLLDGVLNRDLYVIQSGLLFVMLMTLVLVLFSDYLARIVFPDRARGGDLA